MAFYQATDTTFHELISEGVCLVDFCSTHCGPCRMLFPELIELESRMPFIRLIKVNIDYCPNVGKEYLIEAVPTLYLAKNGVMMELESRDTEYLMQTLARALYDEGDTPMEEPVKEVSEQAAPVAAEAPRKPKITLNPDEAVVRQVREGLKAKGGFCPCRVGKKPENKCMCEEFRHQIEDPDFEGFCHCMLYYKAKG